MITKTIKHDPIFLAKIKLTSWYLGIIMFVTLSFSTFVYMAVNSATEKALSSQRKRMERFLLRIDDNSIYTFKPPEKFPNDFDVNAALEIRERTLYFLSILNLAVFFITGTLGYFLASKTLKPILDIIYNQKRFISDAAHELKTPLTAMKTDLEVAYRDKNLTIEDSKLLISSSLEEIDKLDNISSQLLQKIKYQTSITSKNFAEVDITKVINTICDKLNNMAKNKKIKIIRNLTESKVFGIKDDLETVFTNLIENAIKYNSSIENQEKNLTITITIQNKYDYVKIKVSDTGIGISNEDKQHIFEPFYRAEKSRNKSNINGYGLGLSIAKEIIDCHEGTISVTSKLNQGSTFIVTLPNYRKSSEDSQI